MSTATLTVVYADVPGFPAGSAVDHVAVTVTGAVAPAVTQTVAPGTTAVIFPALGVDTYSYSIAAQDASGAVLGSAVTGTFAVTAPATVTLSLPASATAVVA